jgi:hypothetical protein
MQIHRKIMLGGGVLFALANLPVSVTAVHAASITDSLDAVSATNDDALRSQKNIEQMEGETRNMLEEYRRLTQSADHQDDYSAELEQRVAQQQKDLVSLRQQVGSIQVTQEGIVPLIHSMADTLEQFVVLDLPFHQEERVGRVVKLKQQLASSTMTLPEKYRVLLEAYQQEIDFSRTIEAWRAPLINNGATLSVEYLRFGRTALYYQTMDGSQRGYWNRDAKQWVLLPRDYNESIKHGLRIARNQQAPQMLTLPLKP